MTLIEKVYGHAVTQPDHFCMSDGKIRLSYRGFWKSVSEAACLLQQKGVERAQAVLILNSQDIAFMVSVMAVQLIGAISVPIEKNLSDHRIREIREATQAVYLISRKELKEKIKDLMWISSDLMVKNEENSERTWNEMIDLAERLLPSDTAEILFTTGTTGKSKGIELTHGSILAVAENVISGVEMKKDNIELIPSPLSHSHGLRRVYANLLNGSSVVLMDGIVFINKFFRNLDEYGVTSIDLVPAALAAVLRLGKDKLGEYRDQIDYVQLGSAPLPDTDREHLKRLLPDSRLYNFYGTTESGCSCIWNFNDGTDRRKCIGKPTVHAQFAFFDENGEMRNGASPDHPGLLGCRGSMNMKGYYQSPELNRSVFCNGFIVTQDLAYTGEDQMIYLLGRQGDVITSGGNKISPEEIEEVANRIAGIEESVCIPVEDPVLGQAPRLCYVPSGSASLTEREIMDYLKEHLEAYKVPREVMVIDAVPRTYNGKINRRMVPGAAETPKV